MSAPESLDGNGVVRICYVAGRYLIFEAESAALLRRKENASGTLAGTIPQQPTQNIYLGLPVELRAEEACCLVRNGSAYVVDIASAHLDVFRDARNVNESKLGRRAYIDTLRASKRAAHHAMNAMMTKKQLEASARQGQRGGESPWNNISGRDAEAYEQKGRDSSRQTTTKAIAVENKLALTLSSSNKLLQKQAQPILRPQTPTGALCCHLHATGYYMTPGLRFGARYSVYPGDPLRFHAHFMANEYGWEEEIPVLDIVGGGRLATAVKKSFLIGGQCESPKIYLPDSVRTYSIEWAAM